MPQKMLWLSFRDGLENGSIEIISLGFSALCTMCIVNVSRLITCHNMFVVTCHFLSYLSIVFIVNFEKTCTSWIYAI